MWLSSSDLVPYFDVGVPSLVLLVAGGRWTSVTRSILWNFTGAPLRCFFFFYYLEFRVRDREGQRERYLVYTGSLPRWLHHWGWVTLKPPGPSAAAFPERGTGSSMKDASARVQTAFTWGARGTVSGLTYCHPACLPFRFELFLWKIMLFHFIPFAPEALKDECGILCLLTLKFYFASSFIEL